MNQTHSSDRFSDRRVAIAIGVVLLLFIGATLTGMTSFMVHTDGHGEASEQAAVEDEQGSDETDDNESGGHAAGPMPDVYAVTPFVLLLGAIALLPLFAKTEHWWESNRNRLIVAGGLAIVTLLYYIALYSDGGIPKALGILEHAILLEYIPFIVLLFSLYTISGGIRISGDLPAHPLTNSIFIAIGGLLASFIGTTGAAMLLIRPLIDTNSERKHVQHTIVFFIFIVCNCGGCLLPIGDPPLFLGYLMGVNFLWTATALWAPWLFVNILLLVIYYAWDHFLCYPKETIRDIRRDETQIRPLRIEGLWPNALLLVGVILSVALLDPSKALVGDWHPWPFLREAVQLGLVAGSLLLGSTILRSQNKFDYHAIVEVAALFIGIFICMQPAVEILNEKGPSLGIQTPRQLFWATGTLSSVLDNAPTYVVFFKTAAAAHGGSAEFAKNVSTSANEASLLIGISLGAVFMGAMTYIGNGPNFMVRAIAEQSGVPMPSFFGYVFKYSIWVLVPVFYVTTLVFL